MHIRELTSRVHNHDAAATSRGVRLSSPVVTTAPSASTPASPDATPGILRRVWTRLFGRCGAAACWWGATAGALPHVLHHAGPLAGAALVAGTGGTVLFAGVGFAAMVPLLWHERRRTQGWRAPVLVLVASAVVFAASTLTVGRVLGGDEAPELPGRSDTTEVDPHGHG